jgi:hypothetical protein
MRPGTDPPEARLTVGALEAFLRDHDVPPNAEVRIRLRGEPDAAGITLIWDPHADALVLGEDGPVQGV